MSAPSRAGGAALPERFTLKGWYVEFWDTEDVYIIRAPSGEAYYEANLTRCFKRRDDAWTCLVRALKEPRMDLERFYHKRGSTE